MQQNNINNTSLRNTKEAFDKLAPCYDSSDNSNAILQWMRGIVHKIYLDNFNNGDRLLELNAGTGEDAVFLASNGINVYATDISDKMIEIANKKIDNAGLCSLIKTGVFSFNQISTISENEFDGVISNFGGLNCINDFKKLSADIFDKLKPGKPFIAVIMNKFCPWEIFYYTLRLDFKNAFRRFKKEGIMANLNDSEVKTFYFSPKEFTHYFTVHFDVLKFYSLALYAPPPYLAVIYRYMKPVVKLFMYVDKILMGIYPFNRFGDHFIVILKKRTGF